jgi:hydrogenase expression/formation protein HypC
MCLAIPGKIVEIDESIKDLRMAKVSFNGVIKKICIEWLPEAKLDDYVMVHAGTALSIVNAKEAEETIAIFNQWSTELEQQDNINLRDE